MPGLAPLERFAVNSASFHLSVCLWGTNEGACLSGKDFYCILKMQWVYGYLK